jgi:uncharacterized protein (DUF433 family)/DNA-binding XRE family transcriptional regulator
MPKKRFRSPALQYAYDEFIGDDARRIASFEEEVAAIEVAEALYALRSEAGLSQRDLAKKVGTTASAICRLEDADYRGHSLSMLRRVAAALGKQVEIRFASVVPLGNEVQADGTGMVGEEPEGENISMKRGDLLARISIDPKICFGKPCIRGHRIWVSLILDFLAEGCSVEEVLEDYPSLTEEDVRACIAYGAEMSRHRYVEIPLEPTK